MQVLREALHYDIKPLVKLLSEAPQNFGETVGRQQFLSRVPHYLENIEVGVMPNNVYCIHTNVQLYSIAYCLYMVINNYRRDIR